MQCPKNFQVVNALLSNSFIRMHAIINIHLSTLESIILDISMDVGEKIYEIRATRTCPMHASISSEMLQMERDMVIPYTGNRISQ